MRSLGRIVATLVVAAVAAGAAACETGTTPPAQNQPPVPQTATPEAYGPLPTVNPTVGASCRSGWTGGKQAWFMDAGHVLLGAVELGTGATGVVLAHMAGGDVCQWLPFGKQLAAAGYHVLAFDFAGSGVSGKPTGGDQLDANVVAAAAYLRGQGATSVVLIGASMGGTAALVAAGKVLPPVSGVIAVSAPLTYASANAQAAAATLTAPVLYVAGTGESAYASAARTLYAATPGNAKTLLLATGSQHGTDLLGKAEPDAAKVRAAIMDFLKAHARGAT